MLNENENEMSLCLFVYRYVPVICMVKNIPNLTYCNCSPKISFVFLGHVLLKFRIQKDKVSDFLFLERGIIGEWA